MRRVKPVIRHDTGPYAVATPIMNQKGACFGTYHSKVIANNEARKLSRDLHKEVLVFRPELVEADCGHVVPLSHLDRQSGFCADCSTDESDWNNDPPSD